MFNRRLNDDVEYLKNRAEFHKSRIDRLENDLEDIETNKYRTIIRRINYQGLSGFTSTDFELKEVVEAILKHLNLDLVRTEEVKPEIKVVKKKK